MGSDVKIGLVSLYLSENSGIRTLAAVLRREGFCVVEIYFKDWVNNKVIRPSEKETANLMSVLREEKVNLVGLSVRASAFTGIASVLSLRIKKELGLPVVWGGIHPTTSPQECLKHCDGVCVGEAEGAMLDLAREFTGGSVLPGGIKNLWVNAGEVMVRNEVRPLIEDLDSLPFPDYGSHEYKYYISGSSVKKGDPYAGEPVYLIMLSRGCVYSRCSFCINTALNKVYAPRGYYYRRRSVKSVINELSLAKEQFKNLKRVRFDDEIFPVDEQWVNDFCREYGRIGLPFECHLHPLCVKEATLRRLKEAGLDSVCVGIQSSSRVNRILYNRHESEDDVLAAAGILHRTGVKACYQVILDDPVSLEDDKRKLFDLIMRIPRPFELYLFSLTVYPGTDIADKLLETGLIGAESIEGNNDKAFRQFRVDLSYPRSGEDSFWAAMLVLSSKDFIPRPLLIKAVSSRFLKYHPAPLVCLAQFANVLKMSGVALRMVMRGELTFSMLRRWLNLRSLITQ